MEELYAITIGRDESCNIVVPEEFDTVSNFHAVITLENNIYTFADESSNGSSINGEHIHLSMTQVDVNDIILLADSYQVDWSEVTRLLCGSHPTVRKTEDYNPTPQPIQDPCPQPLQEPDPFVYPTPNPVNPIIDESHVAPNPPQSDDTDDNYIKKWNWGAFLATLPWGFFHKVWAVLWLIPILGIADFLLFTVEDTTIKTILTIAQVVIALLYGAYFGHYGSEIAWEKQNNKNLLKFKKRQRIWMWVGILVVILNLGYLAWTYGPSIWSSPKEERTTTIRTDDDEDDENKEKEDEKKDSQKEDDNKEEESIEKENSENSKTADREEDVKQAEYVDDYDE